MTTKYCVDCRHCIRGVTSSESRCAKGPYTSPLRFVDPKFDEPGLCLNVRIDEMLCGPRGVWFEPSVDDLTNDDSDDLTKATE